MSNTQAALEKKSTYLQRAMTTTLVLLFLSSVAWNIWKNIYHNSGGFTVYIFTSVILIAIGIYLLLKGIQNNKTLTVLQTPLPKENKKI